MDISLSPLTLSPMFLLGTYDDRGWFQGVGVAHQKRKQYWDPNHSSKLSTGARMREVVVTHTISVLCFSSSNYEVLFIFYYSGTQEWMYWGIQQIYGVRRYQEDNENSPIYISDWFKSPLVHLGKHCYRTHDPLWCSCDLGDKIHIRVLELLLPH